MKIRIVKNKKIKIEEMTERKYYVIDTYRETMQDLYFARMCDFKGILENDSYIIVEVEREGE